jgi:hypothetical protein
LYKEKHSNAPPPETSPPKIEEESSFEISISPSLSLPSPSKIEEYPLIVVLPPEVFKEEEKKEEEAEEKSSFFRFNQ